MLQYPRNRSGPTVAHGLGCYSLGDLAEGAASARFGGWGEVPGQYRVIWRTSLHMILEEKPGTIGVQGGLQEIVADNLRPEIIYIFFPLEFYISSKVV